MIRLTIILLLIVLWHQPLKYTTDTDNKLAQDRMKNELTEDNTGINNPLTPMEALELVKEAYAANFKKISLQENPEDCYYKLDIADYYLFYEGTDDITGHYLFHLYEFVMDDEDTGIGHTVTYGWYWVNPLSGEIWVYE